MQSGQQFEPHTDDQVKNYIPNGPLEDRSCKDICCLVFFVIITLLFITLGVYFILKADFTHISNYMSTMNTTKPKHGLASRAHLQKQKEIKLQEIKQCMVYVLGMVGLAIVLSIVYLLLLSHFPKCVVYTMLVLTTLTLIGGAIAFFVAGAIVGGIILILILLLWICIICCFKESLQIGIKLLQITGKFLLSKPSVFALPLLNAIFGLIFFGFWLWSLMGIVVSYPKTNEASARTPLMVFWAILSTFYSIFFNYIMVFLIATAVAFWYYSKNDSYCIKGLKWIVTAHIGSLTFASLIITILKTVRKQAQRGLNNTDNLSCQICLCCLVCCFRQIEALVQTLNHNAVIVMAITGEGYIDSAKTALGLIWRDFFLFNIIEMIGAIVFFGGIIIIIGIPTIVGYLLMKHTMQSANQPDISPALAVGVFAIIILSLIIAIIFITTLSQANASIFVLYCLDKKYDSMNLPICKSIAPDIKQVLGQIRSNNTNQIPYNVNPYPQNPQSQPYNQQPQYGQPQYGQPQYGQPQYGQNPYGQPNQFNRNTQQNYGY